jgi:very-short-patch-repair endonuclease
MKKPTPICSGQFITESKYLHSKSLRRPITPAETALWKRLRNNQPDEFHYRRRQVLAGLLVDFYCRKAGHVLEADGGVHSEKEEADDERERGGEAVRSEKKAAFES